MLPDIRSSRRFTDVRIGSRVAGRRRDCNMTSAELAAALGLTETELTEREVGKCSFLASEIAHLATLFGVLPSWFFDNLELDASDEPF